MRKGKIRAIRDEVPNWYSYKMAIIGTLQDNYLQLTIEADKMHIWRTSIYSTGREKVKTYKRTPWKDFYENELPKFLLEEAVTVSE